MEDSMDTVGAVGMAPEEALPSFADVAQEPGGAWPNGWYSGTIVKGFSTKKGKVVETEDTQSKGGDSRNLRLAIHANGGGLGERDMFYSTNYRLTDLTAENVARVKANNADIRLRIALGKIGQIEKATGMSFKRHPLGNLIPDVFVGQKIDLRLGTDDKGYNEITAFAPAGTRVK